MKKRIKPSSLAVLLTLSAVITGIAIGIGTYTFSYANGASYLSNQPEACANCHIMREVLHDWSSGDHHHVAVCNDCHVPQGPIRKWLVKGLNGLHHSYAFTFLDSDVNLHASSLSQRVVQENCLRCHGTLFPDGVNQEAQVRKLTHSNPQTKCTTCHQQVGHWH